MKRNKLLSILIVLALLLGMLPAAVSAQSEIYTINSPRVEFARTKATTEAPTLAQGNHAGYLERVANMPDYALEYYRWMEENSGPDGVLADPFKGTEDSGEYYHSVTYVSGSEKFTFTDKNEALLTCSQIAAAALDREFNAFSNWAAVAQDIFDREHPEVFWLSGRSSVSYLGGWSYSIRGNTCTVMYNADMVIWLNYPGFDIRSARYQDLETLQQAMNTRDALAQQILADCPAGAAHEQVAYLSDALTTRNAYNSAVAMGMSSQAEADAWECISALEGRSGKAGPVCEGYARAFQMLCNQLQIPCVLVDGAAISYLGDSPEEHMWNYVQIDGGWYAVDVTWNDPYLPNKPEEKNSGKESHQWLLLGSDSEVATGLTFLKSHEVRNRVRANGLSFTNGPVLETAAYEPKSEPLYSFGGKLTSADAADATLTLLKDGEKVATLTVSGKSAEYLFEQLPAGVYQLQLSKEGHVSHTMEVTVGENTAAVDFKLRMPGDVTGDGRINVGDVARIYSHCKKTMVVTDAYILLCMDITGDKRINVGDTARLYGRIRG